MGQDYLISSQTYSFLKKVVTIVLPGVGALYAALEGALDLPNPVSVLGVLAALTLLGGLLMGVSTRSWDNSMGKYDGVLTTVGNDVDTGLPNLELNLTGDPNALAEKNTLYLRSVDSRPKQGL